MKLLVSIPLSRKHGLQYVSCVKIGTKRSNFDTGFWKDLLAVLPTGFWKSLIFQVLVLMKKIMTGKLRCRLSTYCLWSNGINIFDRINGGYACGLTFGGHRVRQISTCIYVNRERFSEAIFLVDEKNDHNVPSENVGLHHTNYSLVICSYLFLG